MDIAKNYKKFISVIACGGKSSRMGIDKGLLQYYSEPQRYHLYHLMENFGNPVILSCNESQRLSIDDNYLTITDLEKYKDIGPAAALFTTHTHYPKHDILLIGCDYPFINSEELIKFLNEIPYGKSAAFFNPKENLYEPLLAYYTQNDIQSYQQIVDLNRSSLQELLQKAHAYKYLPVNEVIMKDANTRIAFDLVVKSLNKS